jgi:8-oxo-dGTP pyrophosphatase MutT (NUDIX family)
MLREIRYQAAIVDGDQILLIQHREHGGGRAYWVIPGGGREEGEGEEACVIREALEETGLEVVVEQLLLDLPGEHETVYRRRKTYLCRPVGGEARPGYEPEAEANTVYAIDEVRWFDLADPATWGEALTADPFTHPQLLHIRHALGYP